MPIIRDYIDTGHGVVYATKATRDAVNIELKFIMPDGESDDKVSNKEATEANKLWSGTKWDPTNESDVDTSDPTV